jgi:hypothetical protein
MSDESQIHIPPSFEAVHRDARGRLTLPRDDFRARYELCEDMAQMLVEPCQARLHDQGLSEDLVLQRTEAGLAADGAGFSPAEAAWVVTRVAELLGWPHAALEHCEPGPLASRQPLRKGCRDS